MLKATAIGIEARETLLSTREIVGSVHSSFRRAINISTPRGRLISVSCHGVPMLTSNIETSQTQAQGFPALATGTKMYFWENALHMGGLAVCNLSQARLYTPRKWDDAVLAKEGQVREALARTADQAVDIIGELIPLDTSYGYSLGQHLARLVAELCRGDEPLAAKQLIGLGPGLTPSGDDVLAGLVASWHAVTHAHGRLHSPGLQALTRIALEGTGRSTLISGEMLRHAARGHMTEAAEDVIAGILRGDDCSSALSVLAQYGATSGTDQLVGILLGVGLFYRLDDPKLATNVD